MATTGPILIVDDDAHIREVVRFALRRAGFETLEASNGAEALAACGRVAPRLVVLDILMPELDGTDVAREIRKRSRVPIIFLSSKDEELDRILGLELGGDDYVTKPFSPRELVARVRAVLRRAGGEPGTPDAARPRQLRHGLLSFDLDRYRVTWDGREVVLTATELGILKALLSFPGKVYRREELMELAYPYDNVVADRTIDSHVRRIRRKFAEAGGDPIETAHGLGYRLGACR